MPLDINGITFTSPGTTLTANSGATNWLSVNANGIMTKPQKPCIAGTFSSQGDFYTGIVTLGTIIINTGSAWNNTTGYFTCPVAGLYLASMGGIASGGNHASRGTYGYPYILKNGGLGHYTHWNHGSYWEYVSLSGVLSCVAGDTISFRIDGGGAAPTAGWYAQGNHGCFFITLVS